MHTKSLLVFGVSLCMKCVNYLKRIRAGFCQPIVLGVIAFAQVVPQITSCPLIFYKENSSIQGSTRK